MVQVSALTCTICMYILYRSWGWMCTTSETCRANGVIKTALNNLHQAGPNKIHIWWCMETQKSNLWKKEYIADVRCPSDGRHLYIRGHLYGQHFLGILKTKYGQSAPDMHVLVLHSAVAMHWPYVKLILSWKRILFRARTFIRYNEWYAIRHFSRIVGRVVKQELITS